MFDFPKRILFVGYGAVGHCTLPILLKHINVPLSNITVLDFDDRSDSLQPLIAQGVRWVQVRITPDNLVTELARYVAAGDLIIDLAWNIDCCEILAVVPRPRRAVHQHVGGSLGSVSRPARASIPPSARSTGGT